jgi:hypothetical protein
MQCLSCRFENMPGLTACGRCGSVLDVRGAAIDVHPIRASRRAKRLRRWLPTRRYYQARDKTHELLDRTAGSFIQDLSVPLPEPQIAARLLVPGWAHVHAGLVIRGRIFMGVYFALLGFGLLFWGTQLGAIAIGFAFSVHVSSALDVLIRQGNVRFPSMVLTSMLAALVLGTLVYGPAGWVLTNVAASREFDYVAPPFQRFDIVLVNRWSYLLSSPRAGDVVEYRPNWTTSVRDPNMALHMQFVYTEEEVFDRIAGGPGDHVVWENGGLTVNDQAVRWKPLVPERLPPRLEITVPADSYLILPTSSVGAGRLVSSEEWKSRGLVPASSIMGRAYLRLQPLSRLWFMF